MYQISNIIQQLF